MKLVLLAIVNTWPIWVGVIWGHDAQPFLVGVVAWATLNTPRPS